MLVEGKKTQAHEKTGHYGAWLKGRVAGRLTAGSDATPAVDETLVAIGSGGRDNRLTLKEKSTAVLRPNVVKWEKGFFAKKEQISHRQAVTFRWRSSDIDERRISAHRGWLRLSEGWLTIN